MPDAQDLRWTHLTPDTTSQWAELTNLIARVDGTEEYYEAEDLAEELTSGFTRAGLVGGVGRATLVGYGQARRREPQRRGRVAARSAASIPLARPGHRP